MVCSRQCIQSIVYGSLIQPVPKNYFNSPRIKWNLHCVLSKDYKHWQNINKIGRFGNFSDVSGIGHFGFQTFWNISGRYGSVFVWEDHSISHFVAKFLFFAVKV